MRVIEITTTQNVTIQYELATVWQRIFAYLLDIIIIMLLSWILGLIFWLGTESDLVAGIVASIIFFFYTPISEMTIRGQTIGKLALGIRVVKLSGKQPTFTDYMTRWAFRMVDIYFTIGSVGILMIASTDNGQRLGGLLSNTTVVKRENSFKLDLGDLLRLNSREGYEATHRNVTRLSEEDMLLVKSVIDRYQRHPNKAHQDAVLQTTRRLMELLGLNEEPKNKLQFLRKVLSDYVVLTR